jgi:hypothetical protein
MSILGPNSLKGIDEARPLDRDQFGTPNNTLEIKSHDEEGLIDERHKAKGVGRSRDQEEQEEERRREQYRNAAAAQATADALEKIQDFEIAQGKYEFAVSARAETVKWNGHVTPDVVAREREAATAKRAEADQQFQSVEGRTIHANGQTLRLDRSGHLVDEQGERANEQTIAAIDWNDPNNAEIKTAQSSINSAQTQSHVASRRAHQLSEMQSMESYEQMMREQRDAAAINAKNPVSFVQDSSPTTKANPNDAFARAAERTTPDLGNRDPAFNPFAPGSNSPTLDPAMTGPRPPIAAAATP